jgi:hypothetical protein
MSESSQFRCRYCSNPADVYDFRTRSYFCDPCMRLDKAVHVQVGDVASQPLCWICRKPARSFDLSYQRYFCEHCFDARMNEEILRGLRREELIAFENSFECPYCHGHENDPAFTPSDDDLMFAGWRVCRSCGRRYSQTDADFLKVAKIELYTPDVCAGSSEEE